MNNTFRKLKISTQSHLFTRMNMTLKPKMWKKPFILQIFIIIPINNITIKKSTGELGITPCLTLMPSYYHHVTFCDFWWSDISSLRWGSFDHFEFCCFFQFFWSLLAQCVLAFVRWCRTQPDEMLNRYFFLIALQKPSAAILIFQSMVLIAHAQWSFRWYSFLISIFFSLLFPCRL